MAGDAAEAAYVERYVATHVGITDWAAYRREYVDVVLVDGLRRDYTMLDVGCGTGGYYQLLRHHRHITGLDASPGMIEAARGLQQRLGTRDVDFVCGTFADFESNRPFDVVRVVGVYGSYLKWTPAVLAKIGALVATGGLAVLSCVEPHSLWEEWKYRLLGWWTLLEKRQAFVSRLHGAGLGLAFALEVPHAVLVFFVKGS